MAAAEGSRRDLVFVDLETTGGNAAYDRITEIGIVRVAPDGAFSEWSVLVNPERPIPSYIQSFTGITDAMVAAAPPFRDIATQVRARLAGATFIAHNARFDYGFLRGEFSRCGLAFTAPVLCTVKLSRRLNPEHARHNLDALMARHGLACDSRHRALGDAQVIFALWKKLRAETPEERFCAAVDAALGTFRLPASLPPDFADDLPEGPGAYRLFAEDGALLYVGRTDSLRNGVCARLALDNRSARDRALAERVRRVDAIETAGPLGALLRQASWIRSAGPSYHRGPKAAAEPHRIVLRSGALPAAAVAPTAGLGLAELMQGFGLFNSAREARRALTQIARARGLCLKLLGLEHSDGACVAHAMGTCKGACVGKEPPVLAEMRIRLALASLKLKAWPFPGRIAIRERPSWGGAPQFGPATDLHVVDRWAYLGTARTEEELAALRERDADEAFDPEVYRILLRHVERHPRLDWIDLSQPPCAGWPARAAAEAESRFSPTT